MTFGPDRWQAIEKFYQAAMDREPGERMAYLEQACSEPEVRREVVSLLGGLARGEALLEVASAIQVDSGHSHYQPGASLGHYRIIEQIGVGGMGEVYRARDTKLDRDVAIKALPVAFAGNAERMSRFEREAKILASLNHPNIAAIYGLEESALVMELAEGEPPRGPMPVQSALSLSRQLADALEYAHERGIIHRDLKPANLKVGPEGKLKVLDFGLAKAMTADSAVQPAVPMELTRHGTVLGTIGYMSPEQTRGETVDKRADIWAFGVVLYELLTGRRVFVGKTPSDSIAAILTLEPDWHSLPPGSPTGLLRRCLRKDPRERLRDIGEARIALDSTEEQRASVPTPIPSRKLAATATIGWLTATVLAIAGAAGWWRATRPAPLRPLMRLNVEIGTDAVLARSRNNGMMAISPDGARLALVHRASDDKVMLGTRILSQSTITPLAGTESAEIPFFSPDGQWIGFFAGGKLKKIPAEGGTVTTLCDAPDSRGASWGDDGNIVFNPYQKTGLLRVSASGGTPTQVTKLDDGEATHRWPQVLPGSQAVLFTAGKPADAGNYDRGVIDVVRLKTGKRKTIQRNAFFGHYLPSGHLIFLHRGTLSAAPFDLELLEVTGPPVPILEDVASNTQAGGDFAFSRTGAFLYRSGLDLTRSHYLMSMDSRGNAKPLSPTLAAYGVATFSPDGKRLAYSIQGQDIWVKDLDRETPYRLTSGGSDSPVWTPDGKVIAFQSLNPKTPGIYWIRADGAGSPQRLTGVKSGDTPSGFSPDGKWLALLRDVAGTPYLFVAPVEGDSQHPRLGNAELFAGTSSFRQATFSPDGHLLAYTSDESGTNEVYVRSFPGPGNPRLISDGDALYPKWTASSRQLFFLSARRGRIMVANYWIQADSFRVDTVRPWPGTAQLNSNATTVYDVAPDGTWIAISLPETLVSRKPMTHLTLLLNFFDELRRKAPVGK